MLLKDVLHAVPGLTYYTLGAIALVLTAGIVASLLHARWKRQEARDESAVAPEIQEGIENGQIADQRS
jgi:hypothetical protein